MMYIICLIILVPIICEITSGLLEIYIKDLNTAAGFLFRPVIRMTGFICKNIDEKKYREEFTEYEGRRKLIQEQLCGILSEYRCVMIRNGKITICGTYDKDIPRNILYKPDAQDEIPFAGKNGNYFVGGGAVYIQRGENLDRLLAPEDVLILRMGRHKKEAAERIIERARDKIKVFDDIPCLQITACGNYLAGFDSDGRTVAAKFDIPVIRIFRGADGWHEGVPCSGNVRRDLEMCMRTAEEIAETGGPV